MPTQMYVHTFLLSTSLGNQTVPLTSLTFTPTVALFFGGRRLDVSTGVAHATAFWGAAVSSSDQLTCGFGSLFNTATGQIKAHMMVDRVGQMSSFTNTIEAYFSFVSMDATQLVINVADVPSTATVGVTVVLLGGDITAAEPFLHNVGSGTGNKTKTLTNGGTPSCVLFFASFSLTAFDSQGDIGTNAIMMLGWMCADGTQGYSMSRHSNGTPTADTCVRLRSDKCLGLFSTTAEILEAEFVSMGAGQYVVNVPNTPTANVRIYGVAFYGGHFTSIAVNSTTSTGQHAISTPGVDPVGVLLQTVGKVTNSAAGTTGSDPGGTRSYGAADNGAGTPPVVRQAVVAYEDIDGADPTQTGVTHESTHCLEHVTTASTVHTNEWSYVSGGSETFTLDHTVANGVAIRILGLAIGNTPAAAGGGAGPLVNALPLKSMLRGLVNA